MINELIEVLANIGVKVKAFADDVKVYVTIVNDIDCNLLQRALDLLQQWADMWQLTISVNKCCVLTLSSPVVTNGYIQSVHDHTGLTDPF